MTADPDAENVCLSAVVRAATTTEIDTVKALADRERGTLGFVHRGSLIRAVERDELVLATLGTEFAGFCQLYRRRDGIVTVYHVAVVPERRGAGIGRELLAHVNRDARERAMRAIRLKCPVDLPANDFYARIGFRLVAVETGRARSLNVWEHCLSNARASPRKSSVKTKSAG